MKNVDNLNKIKKDLNSKKPEIIALAKKDLQNMWDSAQDKRLFLQEIPIAFYLDINFLRAFVGRDWSLLPTIIGNYNLALASGCLNLFVTDPLEDREFMQEAYVANPKLFKDDRTLIQLEEQSSEEKIKRLFTQRAENEIFCLQVFTVLMVNALNIHKNNFFGCDMSKVGEFLSHVRMVPEEHPDFWVNVLVCEPLLLETVKKICMKEINQPNIFDGLVKKAFIKNSPLFTQKITEKDFSNEPEMRKRVKFIAAYPEFFKKLSLSFQDSPQFLNEVFSAAHQQDSTKINTFVIDLLKTLDKRMLPGIWEKIDNKFKTEAVRKDIEPILPKVKMEMFQNTEIKENVTEKTRLLHQQNQKQ